MGFIEFKMYHSERDSEMILVRDAVGIEVKDQRYMCVFDFFKGVPPPPFTKYS